MVDKVCGHTGPWSSTAWKGSLREGQRSPFGHLQGRTGRAVGSESAGIQAGGKWSESVPISHHPLRAPPSLCSTHLGAPERSMLVA